MPLHIIGNGAVLHSFQRSPHLALETDAASPDAVPSGIRLAVDATIPGSLAGFPSGKIPKGADGMVTWLAGDQLLSGSPAFIRHDVRFARRTFVPWHLPGLPQMPLLAIQPRWTAGKNPPDYWNFSVRIAGNGAASPQLLEALEISREPWARLSRALLAEQTSAGSGVEPLLKMWESRGTISALLASLALRNLIVLCFRQNDAARAEKLLEAGLQTFPTYAELAYLAALWNYQQNRASRAIALLEKTKTGDRGFLGAGGESSYRSDWLMGLIALRIGNERMAFDHFLPAMSHRPVFTPAAEELLRRRWPPRLIAAHEAEFARAAFYPHLREKICEFFIEHRSFAAVEGLLRSASFPPEITVRLQERLRAALAPYRVQNVSKTGKPGVLLAGTFFEHTSLARINREIGASLLTDSHLQLSVESTARATCFPEMFPHGEELHAAVLAPLQRLDLTIRHQWPPDFRRPAAGKLAVILPWEYGSVPRVWVRAIEENVDELWVPSEFVRSVFRQAGVRGTNIEVIPNGFDPAIFTPQGPTSRPLGCRRFAFLFVGGAIRRKGIDILLEAYRAAFESGEDVTLVLHLSGLAGSYQHNSLVASVQAMVADPTSPHVQLLTDTLDDKTMASLYRGCDAFVLPYRGEGFGLPLLEAQACGKPVITTAQGPASEFCSDKTAYFISAREVAVPDEPPPLGPIAGPFTWFEPDVRELIRTLRHVYNNAREAAEKGRTAAQAVKKNYAWSEITRLYRRRTQALVGTEAAAPLDVAPRVLIH
jgi:glycosyltransferase involved in cell wall biosynthesis